MPKKLTVIFPTVTYLADELAGDAARFVEGLVGASKALGIAPHVELEDCEAPAEPEAPQA